jgi:hypothetical protein
MFLVVFIPEFFYLMKRRMARSYLHVISFREGMFPFLHGLLLFYKKIFSRQAAHLIIGIPTCLLNEKCGAGGSRTRVQTGKPYAFYMLIPALVFVM